MTDRLNLDLTGRRALVCGASRGIGNATARVLAAHGASVTVLARDAARLDAVVAALPQSAGQRHDSIACDVLDVDALRDRVGAAAAGDGTIHILVNNTGGPAAGPALSADAGDFLLAFRQHLVAGQALVQTLWQGMRDAGYGRIVNIISTSVREPIPQLGVSNTVRGAMASWAKTLSGELGRYGITVNNVLPGYTRTDRLSDIFAGRARRAGIEVADAEAAARAEVPLHRFAEPAEIAGAVAYLASPAGGYVSGVSLAVDGGRTRCI